MFKIYLILNDDEPLYPDNLLLVGRKADAERLINDGFGTYYEILEVISGSEVDDFYIRQIARG